MLKKIKALVKTQSHLVLATAGAQGGPHASLMAFAAAQDASEFWLATSTDTRKYANLQDDPRASLLLDDRSSAAVDDLGESRPGQALTVTAECEPFASAEAEETARRALVAWHPGIEDFLALPGVVLLRLVARRFQLQSGLAEGVALDAEKRLDARPPTA
jgi:hypothetical protein